MSLLSGITKGLQAAAWPLAHIALAANIPDERVALNKAGKLPPADSRPEYRGTGAAVTFSEHFVIQLATFPKLLVAAICYYYFYPKDLTTFATLDIKNEAFLQAVKTIVLRDLVITWIAAGLWDYIVSFSPLAPKFDTNKFNPEKSSNSQRLHDMFWSHVSTLVSSAFEVLALNWMATGAYPVHQPVEWWRDPTTLAWLLTMPYWRITHFFFLHRGMHPWRTTTIPDLGKVLYRWVHSLHHKSKNPIAWSGISMHPIESTGYYTAMLVPLVTGPLAWVALTRLGVLPAGTPAWLGAHPIVMLYTKMDLTMAALIGHTGIGHPGGGSQAHWLHHNNFECNYGENYAPWDCLFGSYAVDEDDYIAKFGARDKGQGKGKGKQA